MFPLSLLNYFEIIAFIVSVFSYYKLEGRAFKLFPLFLFFIVLIELTGRYMRAVLVVSNAWLYNISTTVEFLFYSLLFLETIQGEKSIKVIKIFVSTYPLIVLINLWFIQGFRNFHSYTMIIGSIFMIYCCCLYFYEKMQSPYKIEIIRDVMFWVSTGILFFYLGDFFYNIFYNLLIKYQLNMGLQLFEAINNNLILVLYSCFTIGFLCKRNIQK